MRQGWRRIRIGDELEVVTGNTPPKSNELLFGDFIPLVKPPELQDCEVSNAKDGLSEEGAKLARIAPIGSVLVSCIGNLGKSGINSVPVAFNQQINAILPSRDRALPSFLFYQTLSPSFKRQLEAMASGTTIPIVNKSRFRDVEIVLPPLAEQERIVKLLDQLAEETQRLTYLYERKLAALEELKKSLLQQAFNGEL